MLKPLRWCIAYGRRHRRLRRALLALSACLVVLGGGWLWLRDSSLVAVEQVRISGVSGPEARAIEASLSAAARRMTTLDVRVAALRAAVAPFRLVRDLAATPSFPHGLHISVIEQPPVAAVWAGGQRTAVAADGVLLGPALLSSSLPTLSDSSETVAGLRLRNADLLGAATVLGAAPGPLARFLVRAFTGPKGLTVAMRNGLLAYFGDASRPHAKWLAFARVLAEPRAAGATYVDVRLPERPAAGFPAGTVPPAIGATGTPAEQPLTPEAAAAALNAALASAAGAGSSAGGEPVPGGPSAASEGTSPPAHETSPGATTQTHAAPPAEATSPSPTPGG
jgi:cell division protein FtsQ